MRGADPTGTRSRPDVRRFTLTLTLIAMAALAIRLAYVKLVVSGTPLGQDASWYALVSGPLSEGKGFLNPGLYFTTGQRVATAGYPPGYPTLLAIVTRIADPSTTTFRVVGALFGTVTVVLTGCIGRRLAGSIVGLTAAALAAVYPMLIAVDGALMSETLSIPLLYGAVLLAMGALSRPSVWRWLGVGLLLGLIVLTRADGIITALVLVGACAGAVDAPVRRRLALAGAALGLILLVVVPWVVRNQQQVGETSIATISSSGTIAGANCPMTYSGPEIGLWTLACMNAPRQQVLREASWDREARQQGIDYVTGHLSEVPIVVAIRELRTAGLYHPFSQAHFESLEGRDETWQKVGWAVWLPVFALAAVGVVQMVRIGREAVPLLAVIGSTILVVAVSYGNQRFRATAEPALLVAAALALVRWVPALRRRVTPPERG